MGAKMKSETAQGPSSPWVTVPNAAKATVRKYVGSHLMVIESI